MVWKKVGYIGDSITDPNCYGDNIKSIGIFERMVGYHSLCVWSEWTSME